MRRQFKPWSEIVKTLRDARSLTQTEFAEILGVNQATISRLERGDIKPSPTVQKRLRSLSVEDPSDSSIRAFVNTSPHTVFVISRNLEIVLTSELFAQKNATSQSALEGKSCRNMMTIELTEAFNAALQNGFFEGRIKRAVVTARMMNEQREVRYGQATWTPLVMKAHGIVMLVQSVALSMEEYAKLRSKLPLIEFSFN
ncbi:MAG: helix-turn-helix domain-containing protein [Rhodospirillaceae bacterium]|nr:helix-turn-helix domain-containing protein [Rhodospirillaceae bacterium]